MSEQIDILCNSVVLWFRHPMVLPFAKYFTWMINYLYRLSLSRDDNHFKVPFTCIYAAFQFMSSRMRSFSIKWKILHSVFLSASFNRILIKLFISNWLSVVQSSSPQCILPMSKEPTYYNSISKFATHWWAY